MAVKTEGERDQRMKSNNYNNIITVTIMHICRKLTETTAKQQMTKYKHLLYWTGPTMFPCEGEGVEKQGVYRTPETSSCSASETRAGHQMHHRRCFQHNVSTALSSVHNQITEHTSRDFTVQIKLILNYSLKVKIILAYNNDAFSN